MKISDIEKASVEKDERIENLKIENEKINKKLYEFEKNIIEKEEQFENHKLDNENVHNTPGTRGWSRLSDRKLAMPKHRAKIRFFSVKK